MSRDFRRERLYLSPPHMSGLEEEFVREAFQTNWIAPVGPHLEAFEEEFCETVGVRLALAVASGTAAIHLAVRLLGVAEGGYYVAATASVNSATHEGARLGVLDSTGSRAVVRARVQEAAEPVVSLAATDITLQLAKANGDGTWAAIADCDNTCYGARKKDDRLVVNTVYTHTPLVGYVFPGLTFEANASAELTVEGDAV